MACMHDDGGLQADSEETFAGTRGNDKDAPIPAVRAAALFVPDHLPETYVCAYYSLLISVRAQAKR